MKRTFVVLTVLAGASLAPADEVWLKSGRRLSGEIVERNATWLTVDLGPGRVKIPTSQIQKVETGDSALTTYRSRAHSLRANDVAGWLALALWARDQGLSTQAREAFERVATLDPDNALAQRGLGRVLEGGRWLSFDDSQRARGLIQIDGQWVTPAERDAQLAVRRAEAAQRTAELNRAEAEARAREAEARAAAARSATAPSSAPLAYEYVVPCSYTGGCVSTQPWPYASGGTPVTCGPHMSGPACPPRKEIGPQRSPSPAPTPVATPRATPSPARGSFAGIAVPRGSAK